LIDWLIVVVVVGVFKDLNSLYHFSWDHTILDYGMFLRSTFSLRKIFLKSIFSKDH